jgi:hypothetical protein
MGAETGGKMSRLIDADEVIRRMKEQAGCKDCDSYDGVCCRACTWDEAMTIIEDLADVNRLKEKGFNASLYTMLMRANEQTFVDCLSVDQKYSLMQTVNKSNIQECVCCPFFVVKNETCTLGTPDPDWNKKPEDCKLNR